MGTCGSISILQALLKLIDRLDLGRTSTRGIEDVSEPLPGQAAGQFEPDNALAHTQHLGIVTEDGALD